MKPRSVTSRERPPAPAVPNGEASVRRYLIVNADDFGRSPGINRGVERAHACGIVTSASLMVRWPAAGEAAEYGRRNPRLSLGLHLDLGEWSRGEGGWEPSPGAPPVTDPARVAAEIMSQLDAFRRLTGRGPTHLDSHQHVHREEPARALLRRLATQLGVPLRHYAPEVRHCGEFYGQARDGGPLPHQITAERLIAIVASLPAGVTELGCHPGDGNDPDTMYGAERARELEALCDPRVSEALRAGEVELVSFRDFARRASR